jgi:hypothetical protein
MVLEHVRCLLSKKIALNVIKVAKCKPSSIVTSIQNTIHVYTMYHYNCTNCQITTEEQDG